MITKDQVKQIAKLARLGLTKQEEEKFTKELSSILDFVAKLNEIETKDIEPTAQVTGVINVLRPDLSLNTICHDESIKRNILENAPAKEKNYFKVKRVLE